ncbi:MAG: hypothetical protein JST79_21440 [Acidobacteria bacterium]|jgi:hypothetical protein|nr:hypothetical protein [Acidobacteriota bacterium]
MTGLLLLGFLIGFVILLLALVWNMERSAPHPRQAGNVIEVRFQRELVPMLVQIPSERNGTKQRARVIAMPSPASRRSKDAPASALPARMRS